MDATAVPRSNGTYPNPNHSKRTEDASWLKLVQIPSIPNKTHATPSKQQNHIATAVQFVGAMFFLSVVAMVSILPSPLSLRF
jgi:hypothetical protein